MSTLVVVDDQDSSVVYSGSWEHDTSTPGSDENGMTKSGASPAGLTATLKFTGEPAFSPCKSVPEQ